MASSTNANVGDGTLGLCLEILQQECGPNELPQVLSTLLTIMRNSQKASQYRKLNTKNPKFVDRVWHFVGAQQFLQASGWIEVDESVVLTDDVQIPHAIACLEAQLQRVQPDGVPGNSNTYTPIQNGSPISPEDKKKRDLIEEERRRQLQQMKREKEERKRIADKIKADRDETKTREVKESKAKELKFGSNLKRFGDIGVDLNQGGG